MSIVLYTGLPGAGKSYSVVQYVLIPAAQEGRVIVTNVPLSDDFASHFGAVVRPVPSVDDAEGWRELPPGAVICFDEAWRFFPSGVQANKIPEFIREAFSMHRHRVDSEGRSQQIVLVTQQSSQLSRFVRDLVEQRFNMVKLTAVGVRKRFRVDVYDGAEVVESSRVRQIFGSYSAEVWRWYRSHTAGENGAAVVDEKPVDRRGNLLLSGLVKFGIPFGIVAVLYGVYGMSQFFDGAYDPAIQREKEKVAKLAEGSSAVAGKAGGVNGAGHSVTQTVAQRPEVRESDRWRIAAVVQGEKDSRLLVLLEDGAGRVRYAPAGVCEFVSREWSCLVDGERITSYSGGQRSARTLVGAGVSSAAGDAGQKVKQVTGS